MITILKDDDRIVINGHAGYAPTGCDIVCSAISVLTETLVASLEELTYDEISCHTDEGYTEIEYEKDLSEKSKLLSFIPRGFQRVIKLRWCGRTVNKIIIYLLPDLHFISRIYKSLHLKTRQVFLLQYIYLK